MTSHLGDMDKTTKFEALAMPHLDAAYNLARWLTRNEHNADDLVQTAFMRAFKFFDGFRGGDVRAWLLTIVRNVYFTSLRDNAPEHDNVSFDEEIHDQVGSDQNPSAYNLANNPENTLVERDISRLVNLGLKSLPQQYREVLVLKEIQDLSYKEIAEIVDVPMGTVMSRLARGREMLRQYLTKHRAGE